MRAYHADWKPADAPSSLDGVRVNVVTVGSAVHLDIPGIGTVMLTVPAAKGIGAALLAGAVRADIPTACCAAMRGAL